MQFEGAHLSATGSAEVRVEAARVIARVLAGGSLDDALARAQTSEFTPQHRALLRMLSYGVLRDHLLLNNLLSRLLEHPLRDEPEIHALLQIGVYQLRSTRVAAHAAVNETVAAASVLGKGRLRGLVNAILRRYQRDREALEGLLPQDAMHRHSMPEWLVQSITQDWGEQADAVMAACNVQGPMTLRVNRRRVTREVLRGLLDERDFASYMVAGAPDALRLAEAVSVEEIPGFAEGRASVQDASAQLAASLLDAQSGMRVLDACAAPGGKTAHLLESVDGLDLLALDVDEQRLTRVRQNLERLGLNAQVQAGDVLKSVSWWDKKPFDRILLDAPCSGTGVIRRHPDIKWLRRPTDIPRMAQAQLKMLDAAWPMLAPNGVLLYATCSILRAEGEDVLKQFLKTRPDAKPLPIAADWGEARIVGRRIAPGGDWDGFYYARLQKR